MTAARLISPDTRSALLVALGATLLAIPFVVGLSLAAVAAGIVVGAVVLGLGLAGTAPSGRGTIPLSTQKGFDQGLVIGLLLSSFAFAFVGDSAAALLYGLTGSIQLFITAVTRYSAPRQHETSPERSHMHSSLGKRPADRRAASFPGESKTCGNG